METTRNRVRKSVVLTGDEWKALKKFRASFTTSLDCAEVVGIDRNPLDRVLALGRGAEKTIFQIRKTLAESDSKLTK